MSSLSVSNIKVEQLIPDVDGDLVKLVPTTLISYRASFEIKGGNASLANALRRCVMSEYETKTLYFLYRDFSTTDVFLLNDFILDRIRMVPILQSVPVAAKYRINVKNTHKTDLLAVTLGDLTPTSGAPKGAIANSQIILAYLMPGRELTIENIHIRASRGYEHASYTVACNAASVALDVEPPNIYDGIVGVSSSIAAPAHHRVSFICNGGVPFKELMRRVCADLIARSEHVLELLPTIQKAEDISALAIRGESDTIAALLCRTIYLQNPEIHMVTYFNDNNVRMVTLRIIDEAAEQLIKSAVDKMVAQFREIAKYFN